MKKDIGDHIISKLDLQDIVKVLSDELSGSELNTVYWTFSTSVSGR